MFFSSAGRIRGMTSTGKAHRFNEHMSAASELEQQDKAKKRRFVILLTGEGSGELSSSTTNSSSWALFVTICQGEQGRQGRHKRTVSIPNCNTNSRTGRLCSESDGASKSESMKRASLCGASGGLSGSPGPPSATASAPGAATDFSRSAAARAAQSVEWFALGRSSLSSSSSMNRPRLSLHDGVFLR